LAVAGIRISINYGVVTGAFSCGKDGRSHLSPRTISVLGTGKSAAPQADSDIYLETEATVSRARGKHITSTKSYVAGCYIIMSQLLNMSICKEEPWY